ncbi:hypothetical protein T02_16255 [Trichinella nativa]|uniref:Uncharacterized protein n=1 Tax=Trichinella nativa TaxID=6335 RepID=A0A0V1KXP3_9BILA|nr:hypothetical protein T06_12500 [Trichinella sp. T6]KRZ52089.1 hypothetical protein T02_16255 [Trichinella nativa]
MSRVRHGNAAAQIEVTIDRRMGQQSLTRYKWAPARETAIPHILQPFNRHIGARQCCFHPVSGLLRCQWAVASLTHMDSAIQEQFTASLEDNVKHYEALKAGLKMFIA